MFGDKPSLVGGGYCHVSAMLLMQFQLLATAGNFISLITFITLCWLLYYISHTFYLFIYLHLLTVNVC